MQLDDLNVLAAFLAVASTLTTSRVAAQPHGTCYNAIWLVFENDAG